jgi:hypothetical protein
MSGANDVSKIIVAIATLLAAVGGFVVALRSGSSDSSSVSSGGVTIVLREVGDYERFLDDNPGHWRE